LFEHGLLSTDDSEWRQIQYLHYKARSEELVAGTHPEDWEEAEEFAAKAKTVTWGNDLRQAQEDFVRTIRQTVLKRAALMAASATPGPEGAIQLLKTNESVPVLKMDAQVRGRLIRYTWRGITVRPSSSFKPWLRPEEGVAQLWLLIQTALISAGQKTQAVTTLIDATTGEEMSGSERSTIG
jgi:hypothetical protein